VFVLYGMGGVGKSEVCIKFAEEHRQRLGYLAIFYVHDNTNVTPLGTGVSFGLTHLAAIALNEVSSRSQRSVVLVEQR